MHKQPRISISKSTLITIMMRWIDRLIGIVSTLILARILVPDDFGVVAMASIVVALIDIIFDLGVNVAIIQHKAPTQKYFDTAWSLRILQSGSVAIVLASLAPFAAQYYHDARVTSVIQVMAIGLFVTSFENIGIINFQKNLDFVADFKFVFAKRIVGFIITIALTLLLSSYWGMVLGVLCARCFSVVMSYLVHPMRPRFSMQHFSEIFSVSQWVLVKNISQYLDRNLHIIFVGGHAQSGITGGYTLANEISDIPGTELLAPINRVLFPAFARIKDDLIELRKLFLLAQSVQFLVTAPACVGFVLTAREFVPLALGDKWIFIVPFIQILALSNIIQSICSSGNYVLIVLGKIRLLAITSWLQITFFSIAVYLFYARINPEMIAQIRFSSIVFAFGISYFLILNNIPGISIRLLISSIFRPTIACVIMSFALYFIDNFFELNIAMILLIKIVSGVFVYTSTLLLLWLFAKRPIGAESYLIDKLFPSLNQRCSSL
jgi:lipopolysaccharide exporter